MTVTTQDVGFIHDLASLDSLRQKAVAGDEDSKEALTAAAKQFEAIFTNMLFKSMRDANSGFESDLMNSQNQSFYRQMLDEQMSSELSANGSLGLADMIVKQLQAAQSPSVEEHTPNHELQARTGGFGTVAAASSTSSNADMPDIRDILPSPEGKTIYDQTRNSGSFTVPSSMASASSVAAPKQSTPTFDTPKQFVAQLTPYAESAAQVLGVDPSLLIAQAALETGWGKKVIGNSQGSTHNLFNIKADRSWKGDKVSKQTLEYHGQIPVTERAAFRSYESFEQSFSDYVSFLKRNPRYKTALTDSQDSTQFIQGIHKAGYATDPAYADKVLSIKNRIDRM
ncbi:flagellar rod assembly protein FlgJ [Vibrio sp. qd031]|uniref:flagellar assembly peptidoglycan hydrolase FlgJ n=1 Tax=Vibrio sp. qd031 TaxID=1603038 RepID=UPI000A11663F|nr:flagellar assembly peptidoglycan hydrolase FlgJ [Vibrio sp. qd031]ORT49335.1 flagellar rod assembly protein FlgJ [Vibrio sp. qd031]